MQARDRQILRHIGLHRVSIRDVIEQLYFDGRTCGNVLQRLRDEGYLEEAARLKDGYRLYKLTNQGEATLALPTSTERGAQSNHVALAALWFCHIDTPRGGAPQWRTAPAAPRLPARDLSEIFGAKVPGGAHCVESAAEKSRLYRLYAPAPDTPIRRAFRELESMVDSAAEDPVLKDWVQYRRYAFAVGVHNEARRHEIERLVKQDGLHEKAYVAVFIAPGPDNLKEAIDALRTRDS